MRPRTFEEVVGQAPVVRELAALARRGRVPSFILWGPPGTGKTTLARLVAGAIDAQFIELSATASGVRDIRRAEELARGGGMFARPVVLFVDELHRFNKAQQDALLPLVEEGVLIFIGATTENPSFYIISPLLSRCRLFILRPLTEEEIELILSRALADPERGLGDEPVEVTDEAVRALARAADGDARVTLAGLEEAVELARARAGEGERVVVDLEQLRELASSGALRYDRAGDEHYDLASAFIKSVRGSDPDAALYWLARMLEAGEDPRFICRRMVISAAEDVGLADPYALTLAVSTYQAQEQVGMPEAAIPMAMCAVYLASAPKSNSAYLALGRARKIAREHGTLPVPRHLRNAPTRLMKELGFGEGYRYPHSFPEGFVPQLYLPEELAHLRLFEPKPIGSEVEIVERLRSWWQERYKKSLQGPPDHEPPTGEKKKPPANRPPPEES